MFGSKFVCNFVEKYIKVFITVEAKKLLCLLSKTDRAKKKLFGMIVSPNLMTEVRIKI